jgi:threonine/homoserine/homoserine lactone efflux protein
MTATYLAFVAAATVIIVVPGPTNLLIVSDSINGGVRRSLWTVLGAAISHAVLIAVATAGVGTILSRYPHVFTFIKWFGVLYLCTQGVRLVVKKSSFDGEARVARPYGVLGYLFKGFLVNSTNPKALLFYAALFPPFVNPNSAYMTQLLILASTFLVLFIAVAVVHAVVAQRIAALLTKERNAMLTNRIAGSVMIGAAVWMATK